MNDTDAHWNRQAAEGRCRTPEWLFHPADRGADRYVTNRASMASEFGFL